VTTSVFQFLFLLTCGKHLFTVTMMTRDSLRQSRRRHATSRPKQTKSRVIDIAPSLTLGLRQLKPCQLLHAVCIRASRVQTVTVAEAKEITQSVHSKRNIFRAMTHRMFVHTINRSMRQRLRRLL